MKNGYADINITRDFKSSVPYHVIVERLLRAIQDNDSAVPELVDASTIYFENYLWTMTDRRDIFHGALFGKIVLLPSEDGIHVKYQISVLPYRILALAFLLFGCVMPIYLLLFVSGAQFLVCLQIPIWAFFCAALVYAAGIAILITRLDNLILRVIKDMNPA